jgi:hypothetical protein
MDKLQKLEDQIARHQKYISQIRTQQRILVGQELIKCTKCHKELPANKWTYIQKHWYESPHGCMEGDTWYASKPEVCEIECPDCHGLNYLYNHQYKKRLLDIIGRYRLQPKDIFCVLRDDYPS